MNKKNKILLISLFLLFLIISFGTAFTIQNINEKKYNNANNYYENGQYSKAEKLYLSIGKYRDSKQLAKKMNKYSQQKKIYDNALKLYENGQYEKAIKKLEKIPEFEDSKDKIKEITYNLAKNLFNENKYKKAKKYFLKIENYNDSKKYLSRIDIKEADTIANSAYKKAIKYYDKKEYTKAYELFSDLGNYKNSKKMADSCEERIKREKLSHIISSGVDCVLAITHDNKVLVDGKDQYDGEYKNVKSWENIVSIDGYAAVTIGLRDDGKVEATGKLTEKQKNKIHTWKNIVDIAAGEQYVVALKNNGKVVAEGHNGNGQCDLSTWKGKKIIDIDAGWRTTVGLTENGELLFAGKITSALLEDYKSTKSEWKEVYKISVSGGEPYHGSNTRGYLHVVGLKRGGSVIDIGEYPVNNNSMPQTRYCDETKKWEQITDIAAGDWYTVGLNKDGQVLITGENYLYGWENTLYIKKKKIREWEKIKNISAGYGITMVVNNKNKIDIMGFDKEITHAKNWSGIKNK